MTATPAPEYSRPATSDATLPAEGRQTAPVHTKAVTDTPDPVAAALSALASHKETCAPCRDVSPCTRLPALRAAWRRALTGRDGEDDRITTDGAAR